MSARAFQVKLTLVNNARPPPLEITNFAPHIWSLAFLPAPHGRVQFGDAAHTLTWLAVETSVP